MSADVIKIVTESEKLGLSLNVHLCYGYIEEDRDS